ncbi:MAG TPA: IS110 family transposase [Acidimicrobiales bacterium]
MTEEHMTITCGIDWAERHHDVALVDHEGVVVARQRIDTGVTGFSELVGLIAEHAQDLTGVPVAIETDKGLLVAALAAAGFSVYAINPRAVARYRERYAQAGGKSDPGDAIVLANILRTDRPMHRPLPQPSELAAAVKVLARQHQEAIWARQQTVNRLRSLLSEFFPNALKAFPVLTHRAALTILAAVPTPAAAAKLTHRRVVTLLRRSGRGDRPGLADRILADLTAPTLRQLPLVEAAFGKSVRGLVTVIDAMQSAISELEAALNAEFARHHHADLLRSAPGLGPILAARALGEIGDDPGRFATADALRCFAGTAPITRASGRSKIVSARRIRNRRLADACHWWAFASITKSPGARAHYDRRRAAGDSHNAALRNLANRLLGRLWWCLTTNQPWDDNAAWPTIPTDAEPAAA